MDHLLPCPGCARHVRALDSLCPFCGEAMPLSLRQRAPRVPGRRLGRAATLAFGAALAASACSDGTTGERDSGSQIDAGGGSDDAGSGEDDAGGAVDAGDPGDDAGSSPDDAGTDSGGVAPLYGGPPPSDAGEMQDPDAGGGVVPLYGGPGLRDGGPMRDRDAGGIVPLYGGPGTPA